MAEAGVMFLVVEHVDTYLSAILEGNVLLFSDPIQAQREMVCRELRQVFRARLTQDLAVSGKRHEVVSESCVYPRTAREQEKQNSNKRPTHRLLSPSLPDHFCAGAVCRLYDS